MGLSNKHMDLLTRKKLETLLEDREGPCVSIYMPTHRKKEPDRDPIVLKNLLRSAEKHLADLDMRSSDIQDLLEPIRKILKDDLFWQYQCDGLALFLSPGGLDSYRLPISFPKLEIVGKRFHIKPLLPMLTVDGRFYVLALSQGGVRLLQGSRYTVNEVKIKDVPVSLKEHLSRDEFEKSIQQHTGMGRNAANGKRRAMFHGQGTAGDKSNFKKFIINYFRHLDNGVCDLLGDEAAPLVLAGVEYIRGLYREVNHYEFLAPADIDDNPLQLGDEELHDGAWKIVAPLFKKDRQEAMDRFFHLAGSRDRRVAGSLETVVPNACYQRVDTLFVPMNVQHWGRFDPAENQVHVHDEFQPGDEDLLDLAVAHTLKNGGTVYAMKSSEMPDGAPVTAILR